ncbi:hypothetical protein BV25DRAFT_1823532 [Artomyces pyxidatus]|uniref:Uncharacterized protein n=1 Tax=Artomyces pyxidatus TaxID=48021 RepID=A0ACB8T7C1_9AGAM|nr:hypothetical protein BV25DRAFT_1823532 [Artomyces pyxidatus]
MQPFSTAVALVLSLAAFSSSASAQVLDDCVGGWEWSYNSLGQTPCLVDAFLNEACDGAAYCPCNTVVYSLASACSACRNLFWFDWDDWYLNNNCTTLLLDLSSLTIPDTTRVPQWAFNPVYGTWNSTLAENIGDLPENGPAPAPVTTTSTTAPTTSAVSAASTHHGLSRGAKGAIAGGVVGGVAAILAALLLFNRRRTRTAGAGFRERVRARYFDMKVGPTGVENVRMHEGPFVQGAVSVPPEKSAV